MTPVDEALAAGGIIIDDQALEVVCDRSLPAGSIWRRTWAGDVTRLR